ncbi:MAG: hypothetical protein U9R58_09330 [Chloroflexota bacterium]|nr:hypothetical protein [Chloroflexota bacterium]
MKTKVLIISGIILLIALVSVPRLAGTGRYVTADEPTWARFSANYYYALANKYYAGTYQIGYPGVTTMAIGAAAFQLEFPEYVRYGQADPGDMGVLYSFMNHGPNPIELLAAARKLMSLVILVALGVSFFYARQIYLTLPTLLGFLFIAFDPFHIAHSRVLHTNALLASFMFLSVLSFLYYLQFRRWHALVVSGLAAALSILTVTPGLILLPVIGLMAVVDWFSKRSASGESDLMRTVRKYLVPLTLWGVFILLFAVLFWPALWVDFLGTVREVLDYTLTSAQGASVVIDAEGGQGSTMGQGSNPILFYLRAYAWRSTPLVWIGIFLAVMAMLVSKGKWLTNLQSRGILMLLLYAVVYVGIMSLGEKKFDRYLLPIFLPLDLIAGVGWVAAVDWIACRYERLRKPVFQYGAIALLAVFQMAFALPYQPYYLNYYNPLLGKADDVPADMFAGWGEGLSEAALYLDQNVNKEKEVAIAWYPLAFNWFSQGLGFWAEPIYADAEISEEQLGEYLHVDYAVIYINQWQRDMPHELMVAIEGLTPEHVIEIDGVEYVRIYRMR